MTEVSDTESVAVKTSQFSKGAHVLVETGALRGMEATVVGPSGMERLLLTLEPDLPGVFLEIEEGALGPAGH